jgi:hypothetical protein
VRVVAKSSVNDVHGHVTVGVIELNRLLTLLSVRYWFGQFPAWQDSVG